MRGLNLFVAAFSVLAIFTITTPAKAATQYTVGNGATVTIDEFGVCKDVTNNHASGNSIMCPTNSANEWYTGGASFLENLPAGVTAANCAAGGGCTPNTWTQVANLPEAKSYHSTATLSDGRVLVCGGNIAIAASSSRCDIYDPAANSWTQVTSMPVALSDRGMSTLLDGRVLICGGFPSGIYAQPVARCDIYDPVANSFTQVANLPEQKGSAPLSTLSNGKALICGGVISVSIGGVTSSNKCYSYDPVANSFTQVANLPEIKYGHSSSTLSDGRVLMCGGSIGFGVVLNRCDIYDPVANSFTQVANLPETKYYHTSSTLSDGRVLMCNGTATAASNRCDAYDPVANSWTQVANSPQTAFGLGASTLSDGRVLACGGGTNRCDIYNVNCAPACAGTLVGGYCWYLGPAADIFTPGVSCDSVCATHGGCNIAGTRDYAGSGGPLANCTAVLTALTIGSGNALGGDSPSIGPVGCYWNAAFPTFRFREDLPATTCAGSWLAAARACACNN